MGHNKLLAQFVMSLSIHEPKIKKKFTGYFLTNIPYTSMPISMTIASSSAVDIMPKVCRSLADSVFSEGAAVGDVVGAEDGDSVGVGSTDGVAAGDTDGVAL